MPHSPKHPTPRPAQPIQRHSIWAGRTAQLADQANFNTWASGSGPWLTVINNEVALAPLHIIQFDLINAEAFFGLIEARLGLQLLDRLISLFLATENANQLHIFVFTIHVRDVLNQVNLFHSAII